MTVEIELNRSGDSATSGGILLGGQFSARNSPVKVLLAYAFGVSDLRLVDSFMVGAPS